MKISDFKEWDRSEFMEAVEKIIKNKGICRKKNNVTCPFSILNSNDSKYCVSSSFDKVRYANEFRSLYKGNKLLQELKSIYENPAKPNTNERIKEIKDEVKGLNASSVFIDERGQKASMEQMTKEEKQEPFELKEGMKIKLIHSHLSEDLIRTFSHYKTGSFGEKQIYTTYGTWTVEDMIDWEATRKLNPQGLGEPKQELYVIWNPKGKNPRHKHTSLEDAEKEAERLANANPNQEFYVLKAVKKAVGKVNIEWE